MDGFELLTPLQASVVLGLALGAVYGVLAQRSRFCLRRSLVGEWSECLPALGVWAMGLAVAIAGTQGASVAGLISFDAHRFLAPDLPVVAVLVGGALFGAGMVLSGGCASRLAVLTGSGNLRSALVLVVFAVVAYAMMKGVLAPLRSALAGLTLDPGGRVALTALPGGPVWAWGLVLAAAIVAFRSGAAPRHLAMGAVIGLLVPLGWVGTGFVLLDDFDPVPLQSLSFTGPVADTLFWTMAATAVPAGFGTGLAAGVVAGSIAASACAGEFRWTSLEGARQTGRYMAGAALMGTGGVLAGGCTVGAGLSGVSTGSIAAVLALAAMAVSARIVGRLLDEGPARAAS
ncbi:MAG: YeeE/YedE family protein [Deltaproteobacteria bacterium]|nr:YeeE/YedE family protein [Deltaproteobacteria bacterium]